MELAIQRLILTPTSTCGTLYVDNELDCWTLELPHKNGLPGSCIPAGTFSVILSHSPKFSGDSKFVALCAQLGVKPLMPEIVNIPNRSEIRIHWGNYAGDIPTTPQVEHSNTEGCILLGKSHQPDMIGQSRDAFAEFYTRLVHAIQAGEQVSITVHDHPNGS